MTRVPAVGPLDAHLMIVGMGPEKDEVATGKPFAGASGRILTQSLTQLRYPRERCFITNITHEYLPAGTSLQSMPLAYLEPELARLRTEIETVNPNCILALGDDPLYFLTGQHGITKWAGSILPCTLVPGKKVVASVHPAWLIRGMWKWLTVFTNIYVKRAVEECHTPRMELPARSSIIGPSFNIAMEYIKHLQHTAEYLSFDIETVFWKKERMGFIGCLGLGGSPHEAICIPFTLENGRPYWSESEEMQIWQAIARLLQSPIPKIAQNASFEWVYMWHNGVFPANLRIDTMLLHHLLYPDFGGTEDMFARKKVKDEPGHGLAFINTQYTKTPYYKDDGKITLGAIRNLNQWWTYNTMDVMVTADVAEKMWIEAKERALCDFYHAYYTKPFYHAVRMEWDGVAFDVKLRDTARVETMERCGELQALIDGAIGFKINVRSPQQLQKLFYQTKGYQVKKNRKTNRPTVDKHTLQYFSTKHQDDVLKWIIELRGLQDFISDVLNQPLDSENRTHTHFKLGGTDGARWSSTRSIMGSGSNFQNIPRDGIARKLYLP